MHGIKIPLQDFAQKCRGGGGYCAREGVFAGYYGTTFEHLVRILLHVDNLRKRYNFTEI